MQSKLDEALDLIDQEDIEGKLLLAQILEIKGKFNESRELAETTYFLAKEEKNNLFLLASITLLLYSFSRLTQEEEVPAKIEEGEAVLRYLSLEKHNYNTEKYNIWAGYFCNIVAMFYQNKGSNSKAIEYYNRSIEYRKKLRNKLYYAMTCNNLGVLYLTSGEYLTAKSFLVNALDLAIEHNTDYLVAYIQTNLGMIYYLTGDPKESLNFSIESLESYLTVSKNPVFISMNYVYIILSLLELQRKELVDEYFIKLKELNDENDYPIIGLHVKLVEAFIAKADKRLNSQAKAQQLLKEIIDDKIIDLIITRFAMINLADLLLKEYSITGNQESYEELRELIGILYTFAKEQQSYDLLIQVLIFQARFAIIEGNYDEVDALLKDARSLALQQDNAVALNTIDSLKQYEHKVVQDINERAEILDYLSDLGHILN
ncbi:MAG: tetratricopeptide repeat protein [Candidatus Heimdallarchaeota archaeon]|nr:tetratricopeptide repeat protein [Candidatus Heimdallarchaeota archaeon]